MFSHKVYLEGCTLELRKICDDFAQNAMQDDLGQKIRDEVLEDMLKIMHDLENLEQDTQCQRRRIDEQIEEAKSLMKKIDRNFHHRAKLRSLCVKLKSMKKKPTGAMMNI
ncbi:hypothetical protein JP0533_03770 [Helicobacter pylori]